MLSPGKILRYVAIFAVVSYTIPAIPLHADTWETHLNRGMKALEKGDWQKAAFHLEKALQVAGESGPGRKSYQYIWTPRQHSYDSTNNPTMRMMRYNLGAAYANQASVCIEKGCVEESDSLARLAIPLFENAYGDAVNPAVAISLTALGRANLKLGRSFEAEPILRKALAMYEATLPPDRNGYVPSASIDLANAYIASEKFREAEPLLLSVADNVARVLPNLPPGAQPYLHSALAESQYKLAGLYSTVLEQPGESDSLYMSALRLLESDTLLAFSPEADSCFLEYESRLRMTGMTQNADDVSQRLQALRSRRAGTNEGEEGNKN